MKALIFNWCTDGFRRPSIFPLWYREPLASRTTVRQKLVVVPSRRNKTLIASISPSMRTQIISAKNPPKLPFCRDDLNYRRIHGNEVCATVGKEVLCLLGTIFPFNYEKYIHIYTKPKTLCLVYIYIYFSYYFGWHHWHKL